MRSFWKRYRPALAGLVLVTVIAAFAYYIHGHPEIIRELRHTNGWLLLGLVAGYGVFTLTLVAIQTATLRLTQVRMPMLENLLLTSYSSIANFFGPLQSGPGVRLAYLKARYQINLKAYVLATFLYYGFFALISGFMLSAGVLRWWQTVLVLLLIGGGSAWIIRRKQRGGGSGQGFTVRPVALLGLATLAQLLVVSLLYFVELRSVNGGISYGQALTYTGAANFALFVSLTPGAIGFRESFLLLSSQLHHIPRDQVLAASLLDRTANIVFLAVLSLLTLSVHAKQRFSVKPDAADLPAVKQSAD